MTGPLALSVTVNGRAQALAVPANLTLADLLRDRLALTGCRIACDQGVCGACTVLLDGTPVAACSVFAFEADGAAVETVEGLAGDDGALHPVQRAFLEGDAFQCGFCTAGLLLSVRALLERTPDPDDAAIRDCLDGHLCRCTGYAMIAEAVRRAAGLLRTAREDA